MRVPVPDKMLDRLGGSAFAMNRAERYWGEVVWEQHSIYKNYAILRAYHITTGKPCALYGFIQGGEVFIVREYLQGIKDEISRVVA